MTPHPVDLEPLHKLLDEATRTMPWSVFEGDGDIWYIAPVGPLSILAEFAASDFEPDEDAKHAALIVAAVNALPALLAEVRAARQAMGGLRAALEEMLATVAPDDFSESCLLCGTCGEPNCCHEVIAARAALASPSAPPQETTPSMQAGEERIALGVAAFENFRAELERAPDAKPNAKRKVKP